LGARTGANNNKSDKRAFVLLFKDTIVFKTCHLVYLPTHLLKLHILRNKNLKLKKRTNPHFSPVRLCVGTRREA
jgi:hypothetical protein